MTSEQSFTAQALSLTNDTFTHSSKYSEAAKLAVQKARMRHQLELNIGRVVASGGEKGGRGKGNADSTERALALGIEVADPEALANDLETMEEMMGKRAARRAGRMSLAVTELDEGARRQDLRLADRMALRQAQVRAWRLEIVDIASQIAKSADKMRPGSALTKSLRRGEENWKKCRIKLTAVIRFGLMRKFVAAAKDRVRVQELIDEAKKGEDVLEDKMYTSAMHEEDDF